MQPSPSGQPFKTAAAWIPAALGAVVLCLLLLAPATAKAGPEDFLPFDLPGVGDAYLVEFRTELPDDILKSLRDASETYARRGDLPQSTALLLRRAREDTPRLVSVLRAFGYFQGHVLPSVTPADTGRKPLAAFTITPGPRFTLGSVAVRVRTPDGTGPDAAPATLGLTAGQPYDAKAVQDAGQTLAHQLAEQGYPRASLADTQLTADHATHTVAAVLTADAGPRAVFGEVLLSGDDTVDEAYLRSLVPWRTGDPFRASLVEQGRKALFGTGLFSRVEADTSAPVRDGRLDVAFVLSARLVRTVRLGADYTSDFGMGGSMRWEHRNMLGGGERLAATMKADRLRRGAELEFRKPRILGQDQDLVTNLDTSTERSDAFTNSATDLSTIVDRRFTDWLGGSAGAGYRYSHQRDATLGSTDASGFAYLPLGLRADTRDALLDPTEGVLVGVTGAPYLDTLGSDAHFWRGKLNLGGVTSFGPDNRLTLGLRGALGLIQGADFVDVPADLRLYAGGGGSVRGYGYQRAGEMDDETPQGGLSSLECSAEARVRIDAEWGVVAFLDGGSAYPDTTPDPGQDFYWGAGMGLRYFTGFGPLRLDIAVPLDRRDGVDDAFQVYAGIGQSF